jgi:hypothetical protein
MVPAATDAGDRAMAWAEQIVRLPNSTLRPRTPADPAHECTADWLELALAADGWTVGRDDFSGADVQAIPNNPASGWNSNCGGADANEVAGMQLSNVWATHGEGRTVAIAAHWDAKEDASDTGHPVPAANDGASGMAVGLALQHAISDLPEPLPFRVMILFLDAEDGFEDCHPLAGSHHFAATMPSAVDRLILLDMVGDEEARFARDTDSVRSDPALVDLVWRKAPAHGLASNFMDHEKAVVDDHLPFIQAGVPSIDIIDFARPQTSFPPYWHTSQDDIAQLSPEMMGNMTALLLDVLQDAEFVDAWPGASG